GRAVVGGILRCGRGGGRRHGGVAADAAQALEFVAGLAHGADVDQAGHLVAVLVELGQQGTGGGGGAFKLGLVGLVGEEHVAHIDLVAHLLLPFADEAGLHGDALLGHDDRGGHGTGGSHGGGGSGGGGRSGSDGGGCGGRRAADAPEAFKFLAGLAHGA